MKKEYDFSKATRGKFYRPNLHLDLPVYLDEDNKAFFERIAERKNVGLSTVVNQLLRKDKELVEEIG